MAQVSPASDGVSEATSGEDSSKLRSPRGLGQEVGRCMTTHQKILAVAVSLWTTLGLVRYMVRPMNMDEPFSLVKSLYVMAQILTTVGYGDHTPKHDIGMLMTSFNVLTAVMVVSSAISALAESAMGSQDKLLKTMLTKTAQMLSTGSNSSFGPRRHRCRCSPICSSFLRSAMTWSLFVIAGTVFFVVYPGEEKGAVEAFYMSIITLTTVGFGDVHPTTPGGRLFSIFWMVFGTVSFAGMVGKLSALSLACDTRRKLDKTMLDSMQHDGFFRKCHPELGSEDAQDPQHCAEPRITREDFVVFMLARLGPLDGSLLEHLNDIFDGLDEDGSGFLDANDVSGFAKKMHGHRHASR